MSTRLSSLLVQASVVSVKQIERALERQVLRGGQLDTNLLEIGVGEATILPHLAKSRDLEPTTRSVWPTPSPQILAMLPASTAQQSKLAPLGKEGGRFYVLTHESFNAALLADVSSKLGLAVVPVIIPEFRVHEALSRYYGFPMPPRSAALVAKYPQSIPSEEEAQPDYPWATRNTGAWQRISASAISAVLVPAEPQPALDLGPPPEFAKTVDEAPNPFSAGLPDETAQILLPPEPHHDDATPHAEDQPTPVETLLPPEAAGPEATQDPNGMHFDTPSEGNLSVISGAPEHEAQAEPQRAPEAQEAHAAPPEEAPVLAKWTIENLQQALDADLSRDEILRHVLAFMGQSAPEVFLFQVQPENNLLMSREGVRLGQGVTSIPGIALPLAKTPILQRVVSTKNFLLGFPSEDYGLQEFFGLFERRPPGSVFALPIVIKGRVVAVFLGVSEDIFTSQDVAEIPALGLLASNALLALIQRKKKGDPPPAEPPKARHSAPNTSDEVNTIPELAAVKRPVAAPIPEEGQTQPKLQSVSKPETQEHPDEALQTHKNAPISEPPPVEPPTNAPLEEAYVAPPEQAEPSAALVSEEPAVQTQPPEPIVAPPVEEVVETQQSAPITEPPAGTESAPLPQEEPPGAVIEEEVFLDAADLQEEPSPATPPVYHAKNLAAKLAGAPMQEAFISHDSPRILPVVITRDLLRQTERLEKEHEALDALAALIQTPKPKKAPDPSAEIARLLDLIDLGMHRDGSPIEHDEMLATVEQLIGYGEAALPLVFSLFPGRRLPKTPGVLRLEEGNLLRLLLRFGAKAVPGLKRLVSHPEQLTRFYAVWCLASLKDPETLPAMLPGMFDADPMVRQVSLAGASQFARHPSFAVVPAAVRQALTSAEERHRVFAASLVARFRMVELWPLVLERVEDPSQEVAKEALNALMTLTFQDLGPKKKTWVSWFEKNAHLPREAWLVEALSHKELNIRSGAIQELRMLTGNTFDYLPDGDKAERRHAIKLWENWLQSR
jgi:Type II secretion system (T2SS), protein E, N-terminal domain